jgi:hypothetical protein
LTVDELRRECFERRLDSGGTVRSLRQRLTSRIRSGHMDEVKTSEMVQASVTTGLRNDVSESPLLCPVFDLMPLVVIARPWCL